MHRLLRDIGQHRVGTAEGDAGSFAEKPANACEHMIGTKHRKAQCRWCEPHGKPGGGA